jgi:hypothetical protein
MTYFQAYAYHVPFPAFVISAKITTFGYSVAAYIGF